MWIKEEKINQKLCLLLNFLPLYFLMIYKNKSCQNNSKKWSTSPGLHVQCVFWHIYKFYLDKNDKEVLHVLSQELGQQYRPLLNKLFWRALLLNESYLNIKHVLQLGPENNIHYSNFIPLIITINQSVCGSSQSLNPVLESFVPLKIKI